MASTGSKPAKGKQKAEGLSDGGWTVAEKDIKIKDDGLGSFGGTMRVKNTENGTQTGLFTLTVFQKDDQVASLQGSANEVEAGKTVTVQLISTDDFVKGPYTYDFQTDL